MSKNRFPRWVYYLVWAAVPLAVILAFILRDPLQQYLVIPLLRPFNAVQRFLGTASQKDWWDLLILVAGLRLILILLKRGDDAGPTAKAEETPGRIAAWLDWFQFDARPGYVGPLLMRRISSLLVHIISQNEQRPVADVWRELRRGSLEIPPEIRQTLQARTSQSSGKLARVTTHAQVKQVIAFLEQYLSINHGGAKENS
ncbi:MAG: hypothetical protein KJ063_09475 [Anaerolineae bacterium]|nr:hypothetical protein [Anaerolineae bacterium]